MERNNTHLAGEYFVAAELYRRGFSIGMTIGNAKSIDLFASKEDNILPIQVKAIRNKKSNGWPLMEHQITPRIIYVFVNLNDTSSPDYYIATGAETLTKIKQYSTRGIINLSSLMTSDFVNRWDKLDSLSKILTKEK